MAAVCNVSDYAKSTKLLASTTLRTILGTKNLSEILSDRETIAEDILSNLDRATDPWGVKVMIFFFRGTQHEFTIFRVCPDFYFDFCYCIQIFYNCTFMFLFEMSKILDFIRSSITMIHLHYTLLRGWGGQK